MRVLLDTNVVLDYLGAIQGFTDDAEKVFALAEKRNDIKLVSSSAITDIIYVLKRAVKDMNKGHEYRSTEVQKFSKQDQYSFRDRTGH